MIAEVVVVTADDVAVDVEVEDEDVVGVVAAVTFGVASVVAVGVLPPCRHVAVVELENAGVAGAAGRLKAGGPTDIVCSVSWQKGSGVWGGERWGRG